MNTKEFLDMQSDLRNVTIRIALSNALKSDVRDLEAIRRKLAQHRLEMEAAETDDLETPEEMNRHLGRIDRRHNENVHSLVAHDKQLAEIERKATRTRMQVDCVLAYLRELYPDFVPPSQPPDESPVPPVEIEMRVRYVSSNVANYWVWNPRLSQTWFTEIGFGGVTSEVRYTSTEEAKNYGNIWLAALSKQVGVPLKAIWVEGP